jgi:serine/threonine protein kinase
MKKLEPYFIMECSEKIYGFKEIIIDECTAASVSSLPSRFVYVIFDQFYGDLHSYMKEKKRLDEAEAKCIFKQCVEAVNECHENGIIVRDIKLKKFVFTNPEK